MAKQTVNIGAVANDGTGDQLRNAFDKLNDNFDEVYGNNFVTKDMLNDNIVGDDELEDQLLARVVANDAKISYTDAAAVALNTAKVANATHTGDVTGSTALTIGNDKVTYAKLGAEFTSKATIPSDYDVDFSTAAVFEDTMDADIDYDIENPKVGDVKTLVLTGDGTDRTISFLMSSSTGETFNKMKGSDAFSFTSGDKNLVQIICVSDTANSEVFWYSNSIVAS